MSDIYGISGAFTFADEKALATWRGGPSSSIASWSRAHPEWLDPPVPRRSVADALADVERFAQEPSFVRVTIEGARMVVTGQCGEEVRDLLSPLAAALRGAASAAEGELLVASLVGGPRARLVLGEGRARFSDDDVGEVDIGALANAIAQVREGGAPVPLAAVPVAAAGADDVAVAAHLLFPMDKGRSGRKWAASVVAPTREIAALDRRLCGEFAARSAADLVAEAGRFAGGPGEVLDLLFVADWEIKVRALLGASQAAWLPRIAAALRAAAGFGAQGDLVVVPLASSTALVVELRKKTTSARATPEKAANKLLGWPLRKTLLQQRAARGGV
jgi:hypothetical protein